MTGGDERAHLGLLVERVADADGARELGQLRDDLVVDRAFDEQPRARLAALARCVVDRPGGARDRAREVGVGKDEVRALAAELERDPLHRVGGEAHDLAARLRRAGERDLVDTGMANEVRARCRSVTGHDVDGAGRKTDLGRELGQANRRQRRLRVGLQHDGAAGRECRSELPGRHHQRVVPGDDLPHDTHGLLQRVEEERAADRVRAAADRRDRGGVVAEVLDGLVQLCLDRGDRLAHVPRLELGELGTVGGDRVRERVQETGSLRAWSLAPVSVERAARSLDRAVDIGLARHRRTGEQLARRRLGEVSDLARSGLGELAADEEPVLAFGRHCHRGDDTSVRVRGQA